MAYNLTDIVMKRSLGAFLSENKAEAKTVEGDKESLLIVLQHHNELLEKGDPIEIAANIAAFKPTNDKDQTPHIMRSEEARELLLRLFNFGLYFHFSEVLSKAWVKENLLNISGGVSIVIQLKLCLC